MEHVWDLSILYTGFDDPAFAKDLEELDRQIEAAKALSDRADNDDHAAFLRAYLAWGEALSDVTNRLMIFCSLRSSANTGDMEATSAMGRIMNRLSATAGPETHMKEVIAGMEDLETILKENDDLTPFTYLLTSIKKESRYLLSGKEETLFSRLNISGASAWEDLHSALTSTVKADYRGEKITLSTVRNLAYDPDPAVRRDAYEAELACYEPIRESVAFALNSIKMQVITECDIRGYASPLDKALKSSRMKRETLDALLGAMDEYLPRFWQYLRAKAKMLGHEGGLPWYELFAPIGKNEKKYTVDDAKNYLLGIFSGFDTELHDMVKTAFEENWIDFFPREGKVGGAFDCGVPSAKQSRVLTNFDGAFGDIVTLAHELGHSFHDRQVFSHSILNQEYSMPVAETASTFNEVLVVSTAIAAAEDKDEKLALIESQLQDACQIICDIYSRYLFETSVFENRPEEFMNADRFCELMLEAQKKAYGDGLDQSTLHPYMWLCKGHYYSGSLSFYNFPYAFGGLFARGLYAKYQREGADFVPTYKKMLHATSVMDVEECAKIAGIDLTDKDFWRAGLQSLAEEIDLFCELTK